MSDGTDAVSHGDSQGDARLMRQVAPYPEILADLVSRLRYRRDRGWDVWLADDLQRDKPGRHTGESRGLTLVVLRSGPDSYHPHETIAVHHYFPVPAATYNRESWMRWLFDQLGKVDDHERMEDFIFARQEQDSISGLIKLPPHETLERPLAPCHGPGWDPYIVTFERTALDRRTSFRGELSPE